MHEELPQPGGVGVLWVVVFRPSEVVDDRRLSLVVSALEWSWYMCPCMVGCVEQVVVCDGVEPL